MGFESNCSFCQRYIPKFGKFEKGKKKAASEEAALNFNEF
tara:strand:+ start:41 stop:160 length:120 start_codon:yes stop_codon:yes gene_type:complete